MLRPSSVRDASTCLRCNLRLVLRQIQHRRYQSSDESPQPTQDFPVFPSAPPSEQQHKHQSPRLRIVRNHVNHGRIRGKKGGQRRVESSEALSIASLGQDSEVIVLRDLHEPRPPKEKPAHDKTEVDDAESTLPTLTASDIENMSGRRAIRPQAREVFESIDELRPGINVSVLKEDEFRDKFTALAKRYTIGQLKGYLVHTTAPTRFGSSNARLSRRALKETEAIEITTSGGELQHLQRTAWHAGTTPITKRLPLVNFSEHIGRKMNNKEDVIESILRHAWFLGIEEEHAAKGEMEFLLTPMQFGLLLTKDSELLQPLLQNGKYYTNSRFQLHQADHVIRIVGPRIEAEALARVLVEAYAPAKSADIDLDTFDALLPSDRSGYSLQDILSSAQLTRIMRLTRTHIHHDVDAKRLRIASFADATINDAHRLLVALLDTRKRIKVAQIYEKHDAEDCRLEPLPTTKDLPSFARYLHLGRWVTSSFKSEQSIADLTPLDTAHGHPVIETSKTGALDADRAHSPLRNDDPITNKAFAIMKSHLDSSEDAPDLKVSIWSGKLKHGFWRARIGQSLHDDGAGTPYPGAEGLRVDEKNNANYHKQIFTSKIPGLVGLLASVPSSSHWKEARVRRTGLLAHLIPSPLEQASTLASTSFPVIQLRFTIESSPDRKLSDRDVFADLPDGKRIVFQDMRAIIQTEIVQLNLPSQPADIQFEREQRLLAYRVSEDAGIKSFIDAIFESMKNDAVLRAPPALQIPIPQTIVAPMPERYPPPLRNAARNLEAQVWSKEASKSGLVPVKYLFAGFEYRELRRFDLGPLASHYRASLRSTEAGETGGRRLDLSLINYHDKRLHRDEDDTSLERLVDASVNVINALAKSHVGEPTSHAQQTSGTPNRETPKRTVKKERLQAKKPTDRKSYKLDKRAKQDKAPELETDRAKEAPLDEATIQEPITIEKPESQTRTFYAPVEQEHTEQTSSTEVSTSTTSTTGDTTPEQTSTLASPEPETQEVKAEEAKAPEDEPLSVRLRRMMGGGA